MAKNWNDGSCRPIRPTQPDDVEIALDQSVPVLCQVWGRNGKEFAGYSFGRYSYKSEVWMLDRFSGRWQVKFWQYIFDPETNQIIENI